MQASCQLSKGGCLHADHLLMASAGGCATLGNDSAAPWSCQGAHCVTAPRGTGAPITRGDNNRPPLAPGTVTNESPLSKAPMDPSPFLPLGSWQGSAASSRVSLWDAPGSLPFAGRGVMEDYPPASHSRAGSHSALSPQSNLYRPALKHNICSPPCHQNKFPPQLSGVPLLPGGDTPSRCLCCSNGLLSSVSLRPVQRTNQPPYLMRKKLMRLHLSC